MSIPKGDIVKRYNESIRIKIVTLEEVIEESEANNLQYKENIEVLKVIIKDSHSEIKYLQKKIDNS